MVDLRALGVVLLLVAQSAARLAGTPRKPTKPPPVPQWPCVAAGAPEVSAAGQLRSGDTPLAASVDDDGAFAFEAAAANGTYAFFGRDALRETLAGKWLYFFGDSSLRGLYFSLLQQIQVADASYARRVDGAEFYVVESWMGARDGGGDTHTQHARSPPGRDPDSLAMGWIDAIVADDGAIRWLRSAYHDGSRGWRGSRGGPDRSADLAAAWAADRADDATRLTFRMLTTVERALEDDTRFAALRLAASPDAFVLQFGAWRGRPRPRSLSRARAG